MFPSREEAWQLLKEYNQDEHLINHALAVEGVMRHLLLCTMKMQKNGE